MNNQEIFNEAYVDIITEAYRPIRYGSMKWNPKIFEKVCAKMLSTILADKELYKEFDGFFVSSKLFSFKDILKSDPSIESKGEVDALIFKYDYEITDEKLLQKFLIGDTVVEKHLFKKNTSSNAVGILQNSTFIEKIGKDKIFDKNNVLKSWETLKPLFSGPFGLTFNLSKINYVEGVKKRKDFVNPNYVKEFVGHVYLKLTISGSPFFIDVTSDKGIILQPTRYESMNPGSFLKAQFKDAWNKANPEGFGLLGQLAKKVVTKGVNGSVIQKQNYEINLNSKFNMSNNDRTDNSNLENNNEKSLSKDDIEKILTQFNIPDNFGEFKVVDNSNPSANKILCKFIDNKTNKSIFNITFMLKVNAK